MLRAGNGEPPKTFWYGQSKETSMCMYSHAIGPLRNKVAQSSSREQQKKDAMALFRSAHAL